MAEGMFVAMSHTRDKLTDAQMQTGEFGQYLRPQATALCDKSTQGVVVHLGSATPIIRKAEIPWRVFTYSRDLRICTHTGRFAPRLSQHPSLR